MIILEKNPGEIDLQHFAEDGLSLETIKAFIESKKDDPTVTEFITSIAPEKPLHPDVVKGYLETSEGQMILQPRLDSYANKAINSHDEKRKKEIEAEVARKVNEKLMELNKEDTPEQRMIKEQALRMKELEDKYENDKKLSKINEIAYKEGIDPAFVAGIQFNSVEEFGLYATKLKEHDNKLIEKTKNEVMASMTKRPNSSQQTEITSLTEWLKSATPEQKRARFLKEAEERDAISNSNATKPQMVLK
jgi:DNA-binding transcriptional MerR regulator